MMVTPTQISLWQWLRHPSRWSRSQQLAMAAVTSVALSFLATKLNPHFGDLFAYAALLLTGVLMVWLAWRRFFGDGTDVVQALPRDEADTKPSLWFWLALAATLAAFFWLYLTQMFVVQDPNPEAMDNPLTVALLEQARKTHQPANMFWQESPFVAHWKQQDPYYMWETLPGKRLKLQWVMQAQPFLNVCYLPFVKLVGISRKTIILYSTFYATVAWIATAILAWRLFGRWTALLSATLIMSSLGWLIHVRIGYQQVTPSTALMVLLGLCLNIYWRKKNLWPLTVSGCLLGCLYLVGWIGVVFGVIVVFGVLVFGGPRRIATVVGHGLWVAGCALATALVFTWLYAWHYGFAWWEVFQAIHEMMFGRFQQGEPGLLKLSIGQRMAYAAKCLFIDSRTLDGHVDKYLEGYPAVPWILSVFLFLGVLYAIKTRGTTSKLLLVWLLTVMATLGAVFIFGHRYALLVLPAMSILAGWAVVELAKDLQRRLGNGVVKPYGMLVAFLLVLTVWSTHSNYYVQYVHHKEATFEDRIRGHCGFVEWLSKTGTAEDTLVVLSDPVMFPSSAFVFNTYGRNYNWVYWSRFFRTGSLAEQVRAWEQQIPPRFRRIVYAFSPTMLGDSQRGVFMNDLRPFLAAHPDTRPVWTYAYDNRPPSILVFEVKR